MAENVDQISQDVSTEHVNPLAGVRWVPVYNAGSDDLPAGCLLHVTGYDSDSIARVTAPVSDSEVGLLVNGPTALPAETFGQAHNDFPCSVLYEQGEGTPAVGDEMGSKAGDPKLHKDKTGFVVQAVSGEYVVAIPAADAGNLGGSVVIYVPTATRTGDYLSLPKAKLQVKNGRFLTTALPPDLVYVCCPDSGSGAGCLPALLCVTLTVPPDPARAYAGGTVSFVMVNVGTGPEPGSCLWVSAIPDGFGGHVEGCVQYLPGWSPGALPPFTVLFRLLQYPTGEFYFDYSTGSCSFSPAFLCGAPPAAGPLLNLGPDQNHLLLSGTLPRYAESAECKLPRTPFTISADVTDCSGSGSGSGGCCSGYGAPGSSVQLTITDPSSNCPCLVGTYTLPWDAGRGAYYLAVPSLCDPDNTAYLYFSCDPATGTGQVQSTNAVYFNTTATISCGPLTMSGTVYVSATGGPALCPSGLVSYSVVGSF